MRRFIDAQQDAVVVAGRVPDKDSSQLLPIVDKLDSELDAVRKKHPGYEVAVTGLAAIAARNSAGMIEKLNRGLTAEFALVAIFIGLAFRSWVVTFACILPGIFPVVMSGTLLFLMGEGLQFASVVALTVSFGLRNATHLETALAEIHRVLKPGGRFVCLEFSQPAFWLAPFYNLYSYLVIPRLGAAVAREPMAYQYLVESIRRFPPQREFADMMQRAGFADVHWENLSFGIACLHFGNRAHEA